MKYDEYYKKAEIVLEQDEPEVAPEVGEEPDKIKYVNAIINQTTADTEEPITKDISFADDDTSNEIEARIIEEIKIEEDKSIIDILVNFEYKDESYTIEINGVLKDGKIDILESRIKNTNQRLNVKSISELGELIKSRL